MASFLVNSALVYASEEYLIIPAPLLKKAPEKVKELAEKNPDTKKIKIILGQGPDRYISLFGTDLRTLAQYFPAIQALDLSGTRMKSIPVSLVNDFKQLTWLCLSNNNYLKDMSYLTNSPLAGQLTYLDVRNTKISQAGYKELTIRFPSLDLITSKLEQQTLPAPTKNNKKRPASSTTTPAQIIKKPQNSLGKTLADYFTVNGAEAQSIQLSLPVEKLSTVELKTSFDNFLKSYTKHRADFQADCNNNKDIDPQQKLQTRIDEKIALSVLKYHLTSYRDNDHILDSLMSNERGIGHLAIEHENPDALEMLIKIDSAVIASKRYPGKLTPLELLTVRYPINVSSLPSKSGLKLWRVFLKMLLKTSESDSLVLSEEILLENIKTTCIQVAVKSLIRLAYADTEFKRALIRRAIQRNLTLQELKQEIIEYMARYTGVQAIPAPALLAIDQELKVLDLPSSSSRTTLQNIPCLDLTGLDLTGSQAPLLPLEAIARMKMGF